MITAAAGGMLGTALWWRTHPSPCPYGQRSWVEAPDSIIAHKPRLEVLAPVRPLGYFALLRPEIS